MCQESKIADSSLPLHTYCIYDGYLGLSSRLIIRLSLSSIWPGATHWCFCSTHLSQHPVVIMTHSAEMLSGKRQELCNITQPQTAAVGLVIKWNARPLCQMQTEGFRVGLLFCFSKWHPFNCEESTRCLWQPHKKKCWLEAQLLLKEEN